MTNLPAIKTDLLEVRPYSVRNGHVVVEVIYAGIFVGDMFVPERSTIAVYRDAAIATLERGWAQLSAHQQMRILDALAEHQQL